MTLPSKVDPARRLQASTGLRGRPAFSKDGQSERAEGSTRR
jgi:hypothetical protein